MPSTLNSVLHLFDGKCTLEMRNIIGSWPETSIYNIRYGLGHYDTLRPAIESAHGKDSRKMKESRSKKHLHTGI